MAEPEGNKIVIVEDEGLIASDLRGRLTAAGYSVSGIAASGHEAMRVIRQTSPDLVLMDIRIKGNQDGIQVAQRVREEFDIPVVYLTAYEDRGTLQRATETQAYGYIKKPIASASLQGSIELALAKHRHERLLRQQRDWALSSFGAVPYAVLVTDRLGRVSYLNALAEKLTGASSDKALGRPNTELLRIIYRESGEPIEDLVGLTVRIGESTSFPPDVSLERDGQPACPIEGIVAPRWCERRIDGTVIVLRDTTLPRFEMERSRQESKHEALRRMADMILDRLPDWQMVVWNSTLLLDSLHHHGRLRESAEAVDRAALDAFEVSRRLSVLANPPEVNLKRVVLKEIVSELAPAWKKIVPGFSIQVDPDPMPVQADPVQLAQALASILTHAGKRLQAGGKLLIHVSHPEPEKLQPWARIRIAYPSADETPATLERVFEPSSKDAPEDLYGTYGLLKSMGGLLAAHLDKDGVVSFDVHLPLMIAAAAAAALPDPRTGRLEGASNGKNAHAQPQLQKL
jgi:AmiR/NasT family two-component response regulator